MTKSKATTRKQTTKKSVASKRSRFSHRNIYIVFFIAVFAVLGIILLPKSRAATYAHWCDFEAQAQCLYNTGAVNAPITYHGWENSDYKEYFHKVVRTGYCSGTGVVQGNVSIACPFKNYNLNTRYAGDQVVEYKYGTTSYCLGLAPNFSLALKYCTDPTTVWVYNSGARAANYYTESVYLSNRLDTDTGGPTVWLCRKSGAPTVTSLSGLDPNTCKWSSD